MIISDYRSIADVTGIPWLLILLPVAGMYGNPFEGQGQVKHVPYGT